RDSGASGATLGFKFGDQHLSVRVDLQGGQVRTEFRTDSADLRDALAAQWGALSSPDAAGGRSYSFAPPQFSHGGPSSDFPSFAEGHPSGQQESSGREAGQRPSRRSASPAAAPAQDSTAAEHAATTAARPRSGAARLHAFA
ncbi:MAG: hypothetical protein ACREFX_02295, partial [Opitutaceae bacterium]